MVRSSDFCSPETFVVPENARFVGSEYKMLSKDVNNPDKFKPSLSGNAGSNWFDHDFNMLWIVLKGKEPIDIITTAVVQVR